MADISMPSFAELADAQRWDAEVFTPFLRGLDAKFANAPRLNALATVTHPAEIPRVYSDDGDAVPFLRAQNIRPFLPEGRKLVFIPAAVAESLPANRLNAGDVLVTRSGASSGVACVFLGEDGSHYTSSEGIIVRSLGEIDGAYLAVYFNTEEGSALCRRAIYGSGQPHVGPKYLERVPVPRFVGVEQMVANLVRDAHDRLEAAKDAYPEAEAELLDRLGWRELTRRGRELTYNSDFSRLTAAGRSDAEFFLPFYNRLRRRLRREGQTIADISLSLSKGTQPVSYTDSGTVVVVKSKNVNGLGVDFGECLRTTDDVWGDEASRLAEGDLVINSTGRGTLGRSDVISGLREPTVASVDLVICRLDRTKVITRYAALFLNSPAGMMQSEQFQTGSSGQLHLYPGHINQFLIYLPRTKRGDIDLSWQEKLAAKVETAANARVEANARLVEARRLVRDALSAY
jgi:hypothetical protein